MPKTGRPATVKNLNAKKNTASVLMQVFLVQIIVNVKIVVIMSVESIVNDFLLEGLTHLIESLYLNLINI